MLEDYKLEMERQELGEKGRKYVEKHHDHKKIAEDIISLLTENRSS